MTSTKNVEERILVVDDNKEIADNMVDFLSKFGYRASAAYGGVEGLERFKQGDFSIVITDLKMPDLDGMELLKAIKEIDKNVVVLMITGYGSVEKAVAAIREGAYDFIEKPFDLKALEVIVNRAMERHTLFRRLGMFRGLTLALIISVPVWLALGITLAWLIIK